MKMFALLVILFMGDKPIKTEMYLGDDLDQCGKAKERLEALVKDSGLTAWSKCIEVDHGLKPQVDPKHRDPKSEKAS